MLEDNKLAFLKRDFGYDKEKDRDFDAIGTLFNMRDKEEFHIDDDSFEDLNLGEVYEKIDVAYSSPGEAALYSMLRNVLMDEKELKKRDDLIQLLKENENLRCKIQAVFYNLGYDNKNYLLEMLQDEMVVNKTKYYLYTFLGKILPLIGALLTIILRNPKFMFIAFGAMIINMNIDLKEKRRLKHSGIIYLRRLIGAGKNLIKIEDSEISEKTSKIKEILKELKYIDRGTISIGFVEALQGFFEALSSPFLLHQATYYKISGEIEKQRKNIIELYYLLGEIEALISVSSYQYRIEENYTKPKFTEEVVLKVKEGVHPLVENPVANSIEIGKRGIVLTGTNMSGKSTFLRMLGTNIVLAQSFYFVLAKEYEACFLNVVSSISPNDDITLGKSYYMAEAESVLRIIKALDKEVPVFCPIDEIFRGTNPIERIALSAEILTYINSKKSISIVATHDRELADILKETYDFFYFSEKVDSKKGLSFDYKLKKGVSQTRNAIKLLDHIGYPKEIIKKAYERSETIEGFI